MTIRLSELIARSAQPGEVRWIGIRPARRAEVLTVSCAEITEAGLEGDRARAGKRAVTLFQWEHLAAIGGYLGREAVAPEALRRNIGVSGLNLAGLRGRMVLLGTARLRVTGPCAPCSRMEEAFGHGGYAAVRGHGGWTAEVVAPGRVGLGDAVTACQDPSEDKSITPSGAI